MIRICTFTLFFFLILAGYGIHAQAILGPDTPTAESAVSYTFTSDQLYPSPSWTITNGTVTSTSLSGMTYTANVKFTCAGSGTITFKSSSSTVASKNVTVSCVIVNAPVTTFNYTTQCKSTIITRTATPGAGVTWFWQTSATGTSTSLGSATTLTVTSSGTYYLRARSNLANCCWGPATATAVVTVVDPAAPTPTHGSRCGIGTVALSATAGASGNMVRWYSASTGGSMLTESLSYTTPAIGTTTTYYISSYNTSLSCEGSRIPITATVSANPTIPSTAAATPSTVCSGSTVTLSATGASGSEGYSWYTVPTGGTALGSSSPGVSSTTTFYVAKRNLTSGCEGSRLSVTVTANALPAISINGADHLAYGGSTQLTTAGAAFSYQWTKNGSNISGATSSAITIKEPANYTVKVKATSTAPECISTVTTIRSALVNNPAAVNWISTTQILKEGFGAGVTAYSLNPNEVAQVVEYQDGLGRTFQTQGVGLSPDQGDIISPVAYGKQGVPDSTFLPYTTASRDGRVRVNALRGTSGLYAASEQYTFYQNAVAVAHDTYPYAVTKFKSTPETSILEQGAPGSDWQPGGHTVKNITTHNTAGQVRFWKPDGTTNSTYAVRELLVSQTTDENGNLIKVFTDRAGNTILKQVQLDETIQSVSVPFLETYYVYDKYDQLIYEIPPKAVAVLGTGSSLNANNATVAELIFKYTYDNKGRLVEKKVPGAAAEYFIYDKLDRLVLTQDGNLRAQNKWLFIKYDVMNRTVYNGIYTNATEITRSAVQNLFDTRNYDTDFYYEIEEVNATYQGYSNRVFPTAGLTVLSVNYYDHYDFNRNGSADFIYDNSQLSGQEASASSFVRKLPTGSKRVILTGNSISSSWITSAVFYDKFDRQIQAQQNNHLYLTGLDKTTVIYDFAGRMLNMRTFQQSSSTATVSVKQRYVYDHVGRVVQIFQQNDSFTEVQVAEYVYNALGQLIDKKLHKNGAQFLQSVDYRYTIRGWLSSINNAQLNVNAANNDETNDYFGMEFVFNTVETGLNDQSGDKRYWNGNVSAIKWKGTGATSGVTDQRSYKFDYDKSDKLKAAKFQAHKGTGTNWTKETGVHNESMTYDHNGNMLSLQRNQRLYQHIDVVPEYVSQQIDNLTFTSGTASPNTILKVEDAVTGTVGEAGFKNGSNITTEYTYDATGNTTLDKNKGMDTIYYNVLGKVRRIKFSDNRIMIYNYSADGTKLSAKLLIGTTPQTVTDYINGFVYENNTLTIFGAPEGRVVKNGSSYEHQYAITDHQGNTRVVFTSTPSPVQTASANFESGTNGNVGNYPSGGSRSGWELFDHTDVSGATYTYSHLLNGGNNSQVGVAKSYKVYPGDKLKLEAYAKSYNPTSASSNLAGFAAALTQAFGVSAASTGEAALAYENLNSYGSFLASGGRDSDSNFPGAFVTILLFDKNFKYIDVAYEQINGGEQVGLSPKAAHDYMVSEYTVKEAGYAYVFISNESPTYVETYFDDVVFTYTPSGVIQYNEYYPFGLQAGNSWTRENHKNNFLYNEGTELNANSGWYETPFRGYDAALGRFMQVDPLAAMASGLTPYQYGNNDPVFFNDPTGLTADDQNWPTGRPVQRRFPSDQISMGGYFESGYDNPNSMYYGMGGPVYGAPNYASYRNMVNASNSRSTCYACGDFAFSVNIYDENGKWVSMTNYYWNTHPGEQTPEGENVIIIFDPSTAMPHSMWTEFRANSIDEAISQLKKRNIKNIANLVLVDHGSSRSMSLGRDAFDLSVLKYSKQFSGYQDRIDKLNLLLSKVSANGNVLFTGCKCDQELGPALESYLRKDINIFMNSESTNGQLPGIKNPNVLMNTDLSIWDNGWRNISTGEVHQNIEINRGGGFIIK